MSIGIPLNTLCNTDSRFIYDPGIGLWRQTSVIDEGELRFTLPKFSAKIDEIQVILKGGPGHSGMPSMPKIMLYQLDNGVLTELETEEDDEESPDRHEEQNAIDSLCVERQAEEGEVDEQRVDDLSGLDG